MRQLPNNPVAHRPYQVGWRIRKVTAAGERSR